MNFDLRERTILLTTAGSRAYGIHKPDSDVDMKGVVVPTAEYFHGYLNNFAQADKPDHMAVFTDLLNVQEHAAVVATKLEGTVYEIRKFCALAADCNPNILDVLFCRDEEVRLLTPLGALLRDNRDLFLSAKAKHTFSGYANAQLKRIRGHRAWLLNPPQAAPVRGDYDLPEHTMIPADQLAAAQAAVRKKVDGWEFDFSTMPDAEIVHVENQIAEHLGEIRSALGFETNDDMKWLAAARLVGLDSNLIHVMQKEREYEAASRHWKQYREWQSNRNKDRAGLEAKYGFDTKHGGHLARLLRMCREILETGKVNVWRGGIDADEIRAIRNGAWSYDQLVEWADAEDKALDVLYKERRYVVPKQPNRDAIDKLCINIVETMLSGGL